MWLQREEVLLINSKKNKENKKWPYRRFWTVDGMAWIQSNGASWPVKIKLISSPTRVHQVARSHRPLRKNTHKGNRKTEAGVVWSEEVSRAERKFQFRLQNTTSTSLTLKMAVPLFASVWLFAANNRSRFVRSISIE